MTRRLGMRIPAVTFFLLVVVIGGWILTYPSDSDPKNIKYVLWKAGLYKINLDIAVDTMVGDAARDKMVVGKTKTQLRNRFGYLLTPADASQYLRDCYGNSYWKGRNVLFIRNSPWMVVFDGDIATNLVLVKGC